MGRVAIPSLGTWIAQWAGIYATLGAFGLGYVGWGGAGLLMEGDCAEGLRRSVRRLSQSQPSTDTR